MKYDLTSTDALFARNVRFAKNVIRESLESTIIPALQADDTQRSLLEAGISESCDKIRDQLHKIQSIVSEDIVTSVTSLIKQVSDIPRLYRRTNKEVLIAFT